MRRKFLLLLEMGLIIAGLALGWSAWKVNSVLEQPLHVTQERLLDVPNGTNPNRMFYRMQQEGLLDDAVWLRLYWRFNMAGTALHRRIPPHPWHDGRTVVRRMAPGRCGAVQPHSGRRLDLPSGALGCGQA